MHNSLQLQKIKCYSILCFDFRFFINAYFYFFSSILSIPFFLDSNFEAGMACTVHHDYVFSFMFTCYKGITMNAIITFKLQFLV